MKMVSWKLSILAVMVFLSAADGQIERIVTDEQYAQFPSLFYLDDYQKCLGRPEGLYCVGIFNIKPLQRPDTLFDMLEEFSKDPRNYNRTRLHRGYCVNKRCRTLSEKNTTLRFENCVARWGREQGMKLSLHELHYCKTHEQELAAKYGPWAIETPHRVFLGVIAVIIFLNFIGTVYDSSTKDDNKKNKLLTSWSIRSNWQYISLPYPDGDPRLGVLLPTGAFRTIMLLLVMLLHVSMVTISLYLKNPEVIERIYHTPALTILQNGTSTVQVFILLSSFLMAQGILQSKEKPTLRLFFKVLLKRIVKISPVYLLAIGFAATWWPLLRGGPMWPLVVEAESQICRRKFWAHAFFYNNFFEDTKLCQIQTWFLAVDMQLYALGVALCLLLRRMGTSGATAGKILGGMFLLSCLLNIAMAYHAEWQPMMFVSVPENIRTMFSGERTFNEYYTKPWGSLPTCLLGLFVAHVHYHLYQQGFKPEEHKGLIAICQSIIPLVPIWVLSGNFIRNYRSREFMALYVGLERPAMCFMAALVLFGTYTGLRKTDIGKIAAVNGPNEKIERHHSAKGYIQYVFCWRGWYALGRLSLSALMLHWSIHTMLVASDMTPLTSSALHIARDSFATACLTYIAAVPLTLMLEVPMLRLFSVFTE